LCKKVGQALSPANSELKSAEAALQSRLFNDLQIGPGQCAAGTQKSRAAGRSAAHQRLRHVYT